MSNQVKQTIKEVFNEVATALETGDFGPKIKIGLTIDGSEHGLEVMREAVALAKQKQLFDIVLIGSKVAWHEEFEHIETACEADNYKKMEELLADGKIQGCVTLHYSFPIGVSTVGRVITPATGKEMLLATTTGTTSANRNEAMVKNAINGIIAAKASGVDKPTVGILNVDGANTVERALQDLQHGGYDIHFGASKRADGGIVMRGNDLLMGSTDVMVCDSLTGNILMKMFSAFNTGGNYEAIGYGYGPGIGQHYQNNICIISRASGATVIANALEYAYQLAKGNLSEVSQTEYQQAEKAGLTKICEGLQPKATAQISEEIKVPDKEVVTEEISGIDVMDLDDAVSELWKAEIYAESGMGCTGPIVLVNEKNIEAAKKVLVEAKYC